jgi:hypothetical protein
MQDFEEVMEIASAGSSEAVAQHKSALWEALARHFVGDLIRLDPKAPAKVVHAGLFLECCENSVCNDLKHCVEMRCSREFNSSRSPDRRRNDCLAIMRARLRMYY